jgi:hypothetical protein
MLREQVLREWNRHKELIQPFVKNKSLIIEALEIHLNQASSFTSENSSEHLLKQRGLKKQQESLTQQLEELTRRRRQVRLPQADFAAEQERINNQLLVINQALSDNSIQAAFNRQKEKNEQIVKECQELLSQLNPINNPD